MIKIIAAQRLSAKNIFNKGKQFKLDASYSKGVHYIFVQDGRSGYIDGKEIS